MVRAVTPIPFVKARFFDRCGKPLAGGKVYTYEANTTTPKVTYKDPYGLTPNTNPIILDAAGEADIYLDGTYRIRITDRNDVLINDVEKIGSWFSDNLQDSLDNVSSAMGEALKPTLQNLNDTVDAAQVEVNRRVFLLDGAIATAAAAGAGANGWTALLVADASGMTQQQVNDKTALFYNTVADLVADTKLKAGKAVITHGYYAPNDGGGARYLIKDTATDYSIPVANNLHAVFADSFDIRKFGIRNNATLDQTTEIQRMVNYADSRVYEIDFLNFSLMSPKTTVNYKTGSGIGRGMAFSFVHKLKNLTIANDKTKTLQQGDCCIFFLPKVDGRGTFELDNVTFDPFVANYNITAGDGDGYMHGFSAAWHKDFAIGWPANQQFMTGYSITYNNINFISPAVSYNLAVNFWCREIRATNITGEYWGLYIWHWCDKLYAENVHGVWRDDLHKDSGRVLVTNLFHEEQEVWSADFAYTQQIQSFKNISCVKKSDGTRYSAVFKHAMGLPTLNNLSLEDINGNVAVFYGNDKAGLAQVKEVIATRCNHLRLDCDVSKLTINDSVLANYVFTQPAFKFSEVYINNTQLKNEFAYGGVKIDSIEMRGGSIGGTLGGLVYYSTVKNVKLFNVVVKTGVLFAGIFDSLSVSGGQVEGSSDLPYFSKFIESARSDTTHAIVRMNGVIFTIDKGDDANLITYNTTGVGVNAYITGNQFISKPNFNIGSGTLKYDYNLPVTP